MSPCQGNGIKRNTARMREKKDQLKNNTGVKEAMRTHPGLKFAMEFFFRKTFQLNIQIR